MFGNHLQLKALTARKRLLIAESELNRAQLTADVAVLTAGVRTLTARTQSFRSVASSAAVLVAGLAAMQHSQQAKPTRMQTVLKGAGFISSLWLAYRTRRSSLRHPDPA